MCAALQFDKYLFGGHQSPSEGVELWTRLKRGRCLWKCRATRRFHVLTASITRPFLATDKQLMATMAIEKGELWTRSKRGTSAQFHFFISIAQVKKKISPLSSELITVFIVFIYG